MCPPRGRRRASPHWHLLDATSPTSSRTRGAQTSPTSTHQPGYPKTAPKTASITRSRPHHRKVHTRQRQQAVPQKARPRRAVATAEAGQVEVRSLRVGLQVAKQQQQRGNGSANARSRRHKPKGAAPESSQVPGPRRGRGDATGGARSSAPRGRCRKATRRRAARSKKPRRLGEVMPAGRLTATTARHGQCKRAK